jgi:hypothetical protein
MRETTYSDLCVAAIESMHDSLHEAGIRPGDFGNYVDTGPQLLAVQLAHVLHCIDPDGLGVEQLGERAGS